MGLQEARNLLSTIRNSDYQETSHVLLDAQAQALISIAESLEKLASCVDTATVNWVDSNGNAHQREEGPFFRSRK